MLYYNSITKKTTEYPYRFKTRNEFEDEFGDRWYYDINWGYQTMDYLLGVDFEYSTDKEYIDGIFDSVGEIPIPRPNRNYDWYIFRPMLILNDNKMASKQMYNEPKQLVYEGLKSDGKVRVVYCDNEENFIEIQKYLFSKGCSWGFAGEKLVPYYDVFHIVITNNMKMSRISGKNIEDLNEHCYSSFGNNYILLNGILDLRKSFGIQDIKKLYNEPKQLVYESKILKYNQYKL